MDRPAFLRLALEHLKAKRPGEAFVADEDRFQIVTKKSDGLEQIIGLANYYAEFEHAADADKDKILDRVTRSLDVIDSGETLDEVRPLLVPRIRPRRYYAIDTPRMTEQLGPAAKGRVPRHTVLAEHLGVGLAIDRPERIEYLYDTSRFAVPPEELDAIALANIKRMTKPEGFQPLKDGLYAGHWNDDYAAERMLVPEVFGALALKGDPVVFLPGPEVIFVTGSDDGENLQMALALATERTQAPRGLLDFAFVLRDGAWQLFEPASAIGAELGNRLALHLADTYAAQREELEELHAKDPEDAPFVANVMGIGSDDGVVATLASWAKGVRTWLPRTVLLGMGDPGGGDIAMVPWADVVELAGDCLEKVDGLYPPRWETARFPDDATFAKLKARAIEPGPSSSVPSGRAAPSLPPPGRRAQVVGRTATPSASSPASSGAVRTALLVAVAVALIVYFLMR